LDDAEQIASKSEDGMDKAQSLLSITEVRTRLNPTQGFDSMEATVKAFNKADSGAEDKSNRTPSGNYTALLAMVNMPSKQDASNLGSCFSISAVGFQSRCSPRTVPKEKDRLVLAQMAVCRGILIDSRKNLISR
jgi:hypothetical protein